MSDDWEHALQTLEDWTDEQLRRLATGDLLALAAAPALPRLRPAQAPVDHLERALRVQDALSQLQDELTRARDATGRELALHRRRALGAGAAQPVYVDGYG